MKRIYLIVLFIVSSIFVFGQDGIEVTTGFDMKAKKLIDSRLYIAELVDTSNLLETIGLITYVGDSAAFYFYNGVYWELQQSAIDSSLLWTKYDNDTLLANALDIKTDSFSTEGRWNYADKIGIGTTTPNEMLDVDGNIYTSGTFKNDNDIIIVQNGDTLLESTDDYLSVGKSHSVPHVIGDVVVGTDVFSKTWGFAPFSVGYDGVQNTAVGYRVGCYLTDTPYRNTFIGAYAAYGLLESDSNVIIGAHTASIINSPGTIKASENVLIGANAIDNIGTSLVGTLDGNIIIGSRACQEWYNASGNIIIGKYVMDSDGVGFNNFDSLFLIGSTRDSDPSTPSGKRNTILLSGYQNMDIEQQWLTINGSLGVGTNKNRELEPSTLFHVNAERGTGDLDNDSCFVVTDGGAVGIGNNNPLYMLDVTGVVSADGKYILGNEYVTNTAINFSYFTNWFFANSGNDVLTGSNNIGVGNLSLQNLTIGDGNHAFGSAGTLTSVTTGNDNVAIGRAVLTNLTDGSKNTVVGNLAGSSCQGDENILLGYSVASSFADIDSMLYIGVSSDLIIAADRGEDTLAINSDVNIYGDLDVENTKSIGTEDLTFGGDITFEGEIYSNTAIPFPLQFALKGVLTGDDFVLGVNDDIVTGLTAADATERAVGNNHIRITINSYTTDGTMTITGDAMSESSGVPTLGATEVLTIDATGDYQTTYKWHRITGVALTTGLSAVDYDIGRVGYWDYGNRDFEVSGFRMEITPSSATLVDFEFIIYKVQDDGSGKMTLVTLEDLSYSGTTPWVVDTKRSTRDYSAAGSTQFKLATPSIMKQEDYSTYFSADENIFEGASKNEGMIIRIVWDNVDFVSGGFNYKTNIN